jgi:hypothetical protein
MNIKLNDKMTQLLSNMIKMDSEINDNNLENFQKKISEGKVSYLTTVLKTKISIRESYVVEQFHVALVNNFQDTGIRVTEMLVRMKVQQAI